MTIQSKRLSNLEPWQDPKKHPYVSIKNLTKTFGGRVVVNDAAAAAKKLRSVPPMQDSKLTRLTVPLKDNVAVSDGNKPKGK